MGAWVEWWAVVGAVWWPLGEVPVGGPPQAPSTALATLWWLPCLAQESTHRPPSEHRRPLPLLFESQQPRCPQLHHLHRYLLNICLYDVYILELLLFYFCRIVNEWWQGVCLKPETWTSPFLQVTSQAGTSIGAISMTSPSGSSPGAILTHQSPLHRTQQDQVPLKTPIGKCAWCCRLQEECLVTIEFCWAGVLYAGFESWRKKYYFLICLWLAILCNRQMNCESQLFKIFCWKKMR